MKGDFWVGWAPGSRTAGLWVTLSVCEEWGQASASSLHLEWTEDRTKEL